MMRTLTAMVALLSLLSNALAAPTVARSETTDRGRYDHFDNFPLGEGHFTQRGRLHTVRPAP